MVLTSDAAQFLTVEQVAGLLGASITTVYYYIRSGKLPAAKTGRSYRIPASALADLQARAIAEGTRRAQATQAHDPEEGVPA